MIRKSVQTTHPRIKPPREASSYLVTVDLAIFGISRGGLEILLVKRGEAPFLGAWALPGGFVRPNETLEEAARRELTEETGVSDIYLEQLFTFGDPGRDPRARVITVSYFALIANHERPLHATGDAAEAAWHDAFDPPALAFDHAKILDYAIARLRSKLEYTTVGFQLLPKEFTLSELQRVYEAILRKPLDKRNFRKKVLALEILEPAAGQRQTGARPAQLYRFSMDRFVSLKERGILFPF